MEPPSHTYLLGVNTPSVQKYTGLLWAVTEWKSHVSSSVPTKFPVQVHVCVGGVKPVSWLFS